MNRTEPHPIEVLLVACWLAVEAACHLLAALVALALARPTAAAGGTAPHEEEPISPVRGMPPAPPWRPGLSSRGSPLKQEQA